MNIEHSELNKKIEEQKKIKKYMYIYIYIYKFLLLVQWENNNI